MNPNIVPRLRPIAQFESEKAVHVCNCIMVRLNGANGYS